VRRALPVAALAPLVCAPAAGAQTAPVDCANPPVPAILRFEHGTTGKPLEVDTVGGLPGCDAPGDAIGAAISWGDGATSAATVTPAGDRWRVTASHRYRRPGAYPVTMRWRNARTQVTRETPLFQAVIRPTGTRLVGPALRWREGVRFSGEVVRYASPGIPASPTQYRARIDWGDGRRSAGQARQTPRGVVVTGRHTWRRAPRTRRIVVRLVDELTGGVLTLRRAVRITPR